MRKLIMYLGLFIIHPSIYVVQFCCCFLLLLQHPIPSNKYCHLEARVVTAWLSDVTSALAQSNNFPEDGARDVKLMAVVMFLDLVEW